MNSQAQNELLTLLGDVQPFRPLFSHDPDSNSITLLLRDCSILECFVADHVTILIDNHPEKDLGQTDVVGMRFDGAQALMTQLCIEPGSHVPAMKWWQDFAREHPDEASEVIANIEEQEVPKIFETATEIDLVLRSD